MKKFTPLILLILLSPFAVNSQNLVVDGSISNNVNWNAQEAPWNGTTYENSYLTGACNANYVMEVDNASSPTQTVSGFISGGVYVLSYRYAFRNSGCAPSVTPTVIQFQFTDATGTLTHTLSIISTINTLVGNQVTFTNNASATHTLRITNPGNANTCGVILDDISIMLKSTPGGVGTGSCSLWLNATSIAQPNNTNLLGWLSQGNNNISFTPPCATPPVYRTGVATPANGLVANYNPYISFNGATQYLHHVAAKYDLYLNTAGGEGGTFFSVYQGGGANLTYFGSRCLNDSRTWARTDRYIYPNGAGAGTNNQSSPVPGARVNLVTMAGKSNGLTMSDRNGTTIGTANNSADIDFLTVGARRNLAGTYSEFYNSSLSEIIIFNTILTNNETQRVRSYLASKYGVTLTDNTSTAGLDERSYLASDGTTYWNIASNPTYHFNVTVIGRDDASQLNQRKSISTDADPTGVAGGNAMLIVDNNAAFSADKSFLAIGHNNQPGNAAEFVDVPAGIQSRMERIWKFQKTSTGVANSVNLSFDMTGYVPLTGGDLRLLVSNSPVFSGASIVAGAYAAPYFNVTMSTTGGVYFTVASTNSVNTPLPIELTNFLAQPENGTVVLKWNTASEKNSDHFEIEKSVNGTDFEAVMTVKSLAPNGTSHSPLDYTAVDTKPLEGMSYYRLKQVDFDKTFTYSQIVSVNYNSEKNIRFTVYPNPNHGEFTADISGIENNHDIEIRLTDLQGKQVYSNHFTLNDHHQFKIIPDSQIPNGIYFCSFFLEEIEYKVKVIVN